MLENWNTEKKNQSALSPEEVADDSQRRRGPESPGEPRKAEEEVRRKGLVAHPVDRIHHIEHRLHQHLINHPGYRFSELSVHRIPNGVCLEGRVYADKEAPDLNAEIYRILGRCQVVNHLVVCDLERETLPQGEESEGTDSGATEVAGKF